MKRILMFMMMMAIPVSCFGQVSRDFQQGTLVRMRMTNCGASQHGFMAQMSGAPAMESAALCPEYVLATDKVVYVICGKSSGQLIPLAEVTRFRLRKNEMLVRMDDAAKEAHFHITAMVLRPEWDREQMLGADAATVLLNRHSDSGIAREQ
jgi:hypothetical protein